MHPRVLRGLPALSAAATVSLGFAPAATKPDAINRLVYAGNGIHTACTTVGTSTNAGYPEHAFTWDVAVRAAELLRARGATVVLTRRDDTGVGPCVDVRARIGNRNGADAVVAIHADGNLESGARGFHVILPAWTGTPASVRARSGALSRELRASFRCRTGTRTRTTWPAGTRSSPAATWVG